MASYGSITVEINDAAWDSLTDDFDSPVGMLVAELSAESAALAAAKVHVFPGTPKSTVWNPATSTANLPSGYTKGTIRPHLAKGSRTGRVYGGVNVAALPTVFLEYEPKGAEQMTRRYPFMSTALDELVL